MDNKIFTTVVLLFAILAKIKAIDQQQDSGSSGIARCFVPTPPIPIPSNLPSITFANNCDYCDHTIDTLTCIDSAFDCFVRCAIDDKCTHFTYVAIPNVGTCYLKSAAGSGGAWASIVKAPSLYTCGYIPKRAFTNVLLNICVGLDILTEFGLNV